MDYNALFDAGCKALKNKDLDTSISCFKKAEDILKNDPALYYNLALALYGKERYEEALQKLRQSLELGGQLLAESYSLMGATYNALGRYADATDMYLQASKEKPEDLDYRYSLAATYFNRGDFQVAINYLSEILKVHPDRIDALLLRARAFHSLQNYPAELNDRLAMTAIAPTHEGYYGLGETYFHLKQYDDAVKNFQMAIDMKPDYADAYNFMGSTFYYRNEYLTAAQWYEKTTQVDSDNFHAYRNWGLALRHVLDEEGAIEKFTKSIALKPDFTWPYFDRGQSYELLGDYEKAIDNYLEALRVETASVTDKAYLFHNIGNIYWKLGDGEKCRDNYQKSCAYYKNLIEENKANEDICFFYGTVLRDILGDLSTAEKTLLAGLSMQPNNIRILMAFGSLYEAMDIEWKSLLMYRKVDKLLTKQDSLSDEEMFNQALAKGKLNDTRESERLLKILVDKKYEVLSVQQALGELMFEQEKYDLGFEYFKSASRLDPANINIKLKIAECLLKLKRFDRAEAELKKLESISANHVQVLISLGNLYATLGSVEGEEYFISSERYLARALNLIGSDRDIGYVGNKTLSKLYYTKGFVKLKRYTAKSDGKFSFIDVAADFKKALKLDPNNSVAERTFNKIRDIRPLLRRSIIEKVGQISIICMALFVFIVTQLLFGIRKQYWLLSDSYLELPKIEPYHYGLFTFGSLLFLIAGIYLPQVIRLKVAGIELEKVNLQSASQNNIHSISIENPNVGVVGKFTS